MTDSSAARSLEERLENLTAQLERVEALLRATLKRRPSKRYEAPKAATATDVAREERAAAKMAAPKRKRRRA